MRVGPQVERDDAEQNRQAAQQRIEEEQQGCSLPIFLTPARDNEVHGDERELEKDIEQHEVERCERSEARRLEQQEEGNVRGGPLRYLKREHKRHQEQHRGEQEQRQAYTVQSYSVGAAK